MELLILALIAAALAALYWLGARRARRAMASRFSERPVLAFSTFYQRYYAGKLDRAKVEELLEHVGRELSIPQQKLLPSDRFDVELRPVRGWEFDSGNGILLVELDKLAKENGKSIDIKSIVTLDDYLRAMVEVY